MKQFEKKSIISTEEVKYSVEFPQEPKYILRRGKLYNFMCLTKRIDHE
jgi:hypothetical protein